jgi:hypothetical protein
MKFWSKERRDVASNLFVAAFGASLVGGVMFNTLGMGENTNNAVTGGILAFVFGISALLAKGGK